MKFSYIKRWVIIINLDNFLAKGWIPDYLLRFGIKILLKNKIKNQEISNIEKRLHKKLEFVKNLKKQPIAIKTYEANEQHYELPPSFFEEILGDRLKYSCGYWDEVLTPSDCAIKLNHSENAMLELTCSRAELKNGQNILDLGCGWGSLSIYMAEKYPESQITALSNSSTQIEYIKSLADEKDLDNLEAIVADINTYKANNTYDRIVSVEMFEHMRNYEALMKKLSSFLQTKGKLFVHIFSHHTYPFTYVNKSSSDWMARYFFAGGTMPSQDLLHYFTYNFSLENQWAVSGTHYKQTLEAWLYKMDNKKEEIWPIFEEVYGKQEANKWWNYWRVFFLSCAEFFGFKKGNEWFISHYLFQKN